MQCIFFNGFPIRAGSSPDKRKKPLKNVFNDKLFFYCYIIFYKALKQRKSWLVPAYVGYKIGDFTRQTAESRAKKERRRLSLDQTYNNRGFRDERYE